MTGDCVVVPRTSGLTGPTSLRGGRRPEVRGVTEGRSTRDGSWSPSASAVRSSSVYVYSSGTFCHRGRPVRPWAGDLTCVWISFFSDNPLYVSRRDVEIDEGSN